MTEQTASRVWTAAARPLSSRRVAGPLLVTYLLVVALIVFWPSADVASGSVLGIWAVLDRVGVGGVVSPSAVEFVTNVLLFVPLSLLGATFRARWGAWQWLLAGLAGSLAIELGQWLFLPGRSPAVVDVVANTLGALVGYALRRVMVPTRDEPSARPGCTSTARDL